MKKNATALVLLLSLLLNGALAGFLANRKPDKTIEVVAVRDTLIQQIPYYIEAPIPEPRTIYTRKIDSIYITDTLRIREADIPRRRSYQDSILVDGHKLHYQHSITGFLNESIYALDISQHTIRDSIERIITERYDPRFQLSLSSGVVWGDLLRKPGLEVGVNAVYRDWGAYYRYDPTNTAHTLGAQYRILTIY